MEISGLFHVSPFSKISQWTAFQLLWVFISTCRVIRNRYPFSYTHIRCIHPIQIQMYKCKCRSETSFSLGKMEDSAETNGIWAMEASRLVPLLSPLTASMAPKELELIQLQKSPTSWLDTQMPDTNCTCGCFLLVINQLSIEQLNKCPGRCGGVHLEHTRSEPGGAVWEIQWTYWIIWWHESFII